MEEISNLKNEAKSAFNRASFNTGAALGIATFALAYPLPDISVAFLTIWAGVSAALAVSRAADGYMANSEANARIAAQASAGRTVSVQQPR